MLEVQTVVNRRHEPTNQMTSERKPTNPNKNYSPVTGEERGGGEGGGGRPREKEKSTTKKKQKQGESEWMNSNVQNMSERHEKFFTWLSQ